MLTHLSRESRPGPSIRLHRDHVRGTVGAVWYGIQSKAQHSMEQSMYRRVRDKRPNCGDLTWVVLRTWIEEGD